MSSAELDNLEISANSIIRGANAMIFGDEDGQELLIAEQVLDNDEETVEVEIDIEVWKGPDKTLAGYRPLGLTDPDRDFEIMNFIDENVDWITNSAALMNILEKEIREVERDNPDTFPVYNDPDTWTAETQLLNGDIRVTSSYNPGDSDWTVEIRHQDGDLLTPPRTTDRPLHDPHRTRDAALKKALDKLDTVNGDAEDLLEQAQLDILDQEEEIEEKAEANKPAPGPSEKDQDRDGLYLRFPLGSKETVVVEEDGVKVQRFAKDGEHIGMRRVLSQRFEPVAVLDLDGETVYEARIGTGEAQETVRGDVDEILEELKKRGHVVQRSSAHDVVSLILTESNIPTRSAHAAIAVYSSGDGELQLVDEPHPRSDSQARAVRETSDARELDNVEPGDVEAWLEVLKHWNPYEILPVAGLSAAAPFAYLLRDNGKLVPHLVHISPESGLGKTETIRIYAEHLFGKRLGSSGAVKSDYRITDALDCYGGLFPVEEAEDLPLEGEMAPKLQMAAEQPLQDMRGTSSLGSRAYYSRAVLALSANFLPVGRKAFKVRTLSVEYDRTKKQRRSNNQKTLRALEKRLEPVGFRLVEALIDEVETVEALIDRVETHADALEDSFQYRFRDPRRSRCWAAVYLGLEAWEALAQSAGVEWEAPSYDEFVQDVVEIVEADAFEGVRDPLSKFLDWWSQFRATERDRALDAEDNIWRTQVQSGTEGIWVTSSVVDMYNDATRHRPGHHELQLSGLRKAVTAETGTQYPETAYFSDRETSLRAVFIPLSIIHDDGNDSRDKDVGNDGDGGSGAENGGEELDGVVENTDPKGLFRNSLAEEDTLSDYIKCPAPGCGESIQDNEHEVGLHIHGHVEQDPEVSLAKEWVWKLGKQLGIQQEWGKEDERDEVEEFDFTDQVNQEESG